MLPPMISSWQHSRNGAHCNGEQPMLWQYQPDLLLAHQPVKETAQLSPATWKYAAEHQPSPAIFERVITCLLASCRSCLTALFHRQTSSDKTLCCQAVQYGWPGYHSDSLAREGQVHRSCYRHRAQLQPLVSLSTRPHQQIEGHQYPDPSMAVAADPATLRPGQVHLWFGAHHQRLRC